MHSIRANEMALIAAIQMASTQDIQKNLETACDGIRKAALAGAKMVALPEEFLSLLLNPEEKFAMAEVYSEGPIQKALATVAKENSIWVVAGTLPLRDDSSGKIFSSCLTFNDKGECVARYNKIHLFDVTVENGESYYESQRVNAGDTICVIDTPFGKMGIAICYDLRFPELFRLMMLKGAQIVVLPSAFTINTGKVHWEILLRARAIENLCYLVAPNQVGVRLSGHGTYGHSMIVGPWGEVLASLQEQPGLIMHEVDIEKMNKIRTQFPSLTHYRSFLMKNLANVSEEVKS
jgi:predicted amidohydrolase